ncbi:MAG: NYN domain-containing protein [Vulcanimicrobiaceae bacterium]
MTLYIAFNAARSSLPFAGACEDGPLFFYGCCKLERVAVFVDAGYLIARGAEALTGIPAGRRGVILDESTVVKDLINFAEIKARCPGSILRVYWYDAAGSQPTAEHIRLAELDNVKLRLGTLNSLGKQKGVDSLIIADMIELARNGAVGDFLLVGGDEDLRIGVQVAQTYGTRVHLLGIEIGGDRAQSPGLAREADTNSGWTIADVSTFLSLRQAAQPIPVQSVGTPGTVDVTENPANTRDQAVTVIPDQTLEEAVREFYSTLIQADIDDIKTVWDASGKIPQPHDGRLLARTAAAIGRSLDVSERREMRRIFTRLLAERADASTP